MKTPTEHRLSNGGVALHVWQWGSPGPAVLLLHGIGNYGRYWDFVAAAVAGRLRLVAPDTRGHGDSGKPADGYGDPDLVADSLRVSEAFALGRPIVCGHSLGGRIAIELAAGHPDRVSGLVVVDSGPDVLPAARERARRLTSERPESFADDEAALGWLRRTSPGYGDDVYANRMRWALRREADGRLTWRSSRASLERTMASGPRGEDTWRALPQIRCPTVVVRGTRSNALSSETARRMVARLPQGRLVETDAGHNVPLERPDVVAAALLELAG